MTIQQCVNQTFYLQKPYCRTSAYVSFKAPLLKPSAWMTQSSLGWKESQSWKLDPNTITWDVCDRKYVVLIMDWNGRLVFIIWLFLIVDFYCTFLITFSVIHIGTGICLLQFQLTLSYVLDNDLSSYYITYLYSLLHRCDDSGVYFSWVVSTCVSSTN